MESSYDATDLV